MKKYLILLITSILFISCDMQPNPIEKDSNQYEYNKSQLDKIETIGDTIVAYEEGNQLYYKDSKGQLYTANIDSNTDIISVSLLYIIITIILLAFVGIGVLRILLDY